MALGYIFLLLSKCIDYSTKTAPERPSADVTVELVRIFTVLKKRKIFTVMKTKASDQCFQTYDRLFPMCMFRQKSVQLLTKICMIFTMLTTWHVVCYKPVRTDME